ncbi:gamma-glutamylcyclotransferase family protein [uncultured Microbacterium sp.]|uniref:gamma-glutamylcyclotransferase family protein n=1 Tax=uncultured Microbacterium sp. TaxID=191216 RepID=UPI0025D4EDE8|nr:gamma-glutamylcyclotransferase family protein [uncultured Microbacterium sp.]
MSDASGTAESLFTYGRLQRPDMQLDMFGRRVAGIDDALPGYRLEWTDGGDDGLGQPSSADAHPVLRRTDDPLDRVFGKVLLLTADELDAADEYEVSLYRRASVVLASGRHAWAYVAA